MSFYRFEFLSIYLAVVLDDKHSPFKFLFVFLYFWFLPLCLFDVNNSWYQNKFYVTFCPFVFLNFCLYIVAFIVFSSCLSVNLCKLHFSTQQFHFHALLHSTYVVFISFLYQSFVLSLFNIPFMYFMFVSRPLLFVSMFELLYVFLRNLFLMKFLSVCLYVGCMLSGERNINLNTFILPTDKNGCRLKTLVRSINIIAMLKKWRYLENKKK